jgi:hypothetical protein
MLSLASVACVSYVVYYTMAWKVSERRTIDCFRHGPEIGASIDVPLGVAGCLRRKRLEAVDGDMVGVMFVALLTHVSMGMFMTAEKVLDSAGHLMKNIHANYSIPRVMQEEGNCRE